MPRCAPPVNPMLGNWRPSRQRPSQRSSTWRSMTIHATRCLMNWAQSTRWASLTCTSRSSSLRPRKRTCLRSSKQWIRTARGSCGFTVRPTCGFRLSSGYIVSSVRTGTSCAPLILCVGSGSQTKSGLPSSQPRLKGIVASQPVPRDGSTPAGRATPPMTVVDCRLSGSEPS